jgi:hypothetical protein
VIIESNISNATSTHSYRITPLLEKGGIETQEQAIESGKKVLHGAVTDRVLRMFEAIRACGSPRVSLDRPVLFTESFKETEGQPLILRWA